MRSILFLSDTVCRRFLNIYSDYGLNFPNINRLAEKSIVFTNHWTGSAPCMPARRDLMTGRLNFLERNWGPIEPFDCTLPKILHRNGIKSHIITDHYHYLELGGEGYLQNFDSWILNRGQEWDPCCSQIKPRVIPEHYGKIVPQFWYNREGFKDDESKYPSPMTMQGAADWLEANHDEDNFLLWVEPFDPHEPFEVPQKYLDLVEDHYDDKLFLWPEYKPVAEAGLSSEALVHIKKRYLALLLMTDTWLGKILDVMDKHDMWNDTLFMFTTDHGYMLGEHGFLAKNYMPAYNEVFHIPLIVHLPGDECAGKHIDAITQNIDVLPTLMDFYGIDSSYAKNKIHGKSWFPLIRGEVDRVRDYAIYGYFGKQLNITDGHYTYFRASNEKNRPLYVYTSMPIDVYCYWDNNRIKEFSKVENGQFLSWTDYPVYRFDADNIKDTDDGTLKYIYLYEWEKHNQLFDIKTDYAQKNNIYADKPDVVNHLNELLKQALIDHDAPKEHFIRLGLE